MSARKEFLPVPTEALQLYQKLELLAHPECMGWFKEVYRSNLLVDRIDDNAQRSAISSIYFLQDFNCSPKWRQLQSDEIFVWLKGSPIKVHMLSDTLRSVTLGDILDHSEKIDGYQIAIPKGTVFNAEILLPNSYSLVACLVSPGWEMNDFSLCSERALIEKYPEHETLIRRFS